MARRLTSSLAARLLAASVLLVLVGQARGQEPRERSAQHDFRIVTVADGLIVPWGMAFLPGGDMLVTERPGRLRIVRNGQLLPTPVPGVPAVRAGGQGGLLDVVAHPRFAENRLVYLSLLEAERGRHAEHDGRRPRPLRRRPTGPRGDRRRGQGVVRG